MLIGIGILVGATLAHYLVRAAQRIAKADKKKREGKEVTDDEEEERDHEESEGQEEAGANVRREFPVLGLDLGSSQACVAFVAAKERAPEVVENHEGRRSTPAFISYEDDHLVVGQLARRARWREPAKVGFNIQRLLGLAAYEDKVRPLFPFAVDAREGSADGDLSPLVMRLKGGRALTPLEASARVLEELVQSAEHKLHTTPGFAILAVPSYFDEGAKRRALKAAADATGLSVGADEGQGGGLAVVEDAVAALVCAHYSGAVSDEEAFFGKPWLVLDVGGLNAQASVVAMDPQQGLGVRANRTTWAVGGEQLDGVLVQHLISDFKEKHGGLDLGTDYLALERLHEAAEASKQELSLSPSSTLRLPFITADHRGPKHLDATVSRAALERLALPVLDQLEAPVVEALRASGVGLEGLQGVLLAGGTARLPFLGEFVRSRLTLGKVKVLSVEGVPPEEVAAVGAAYYGRQLVE